MTPGLLFNDYYKKHKNTALAVVLFVTAITIGFFIGMHVQKDNYKEFVRSFRNIRENSEKFTFINPLIGGVSAPATDVGLFTDTKEKIETYLKDQERKKNLYDYSFYYRDLNTGLWFGANDASEFLPASLFKLPIAIAAYKQAEDESPFLNKKVMYTKDIAERNTLIQLNAQSTLVVGNSYSVEDLVKIMLTASDNGAKDLLLSVMNIRYIDQLFSLVSLVDPRDVKAYQISSRKYAHFLRMLYGSSYLNEEHSELILSMLAKSEFKDGLVAGVPSDIQIAHKFGAYQAEAQVDGQRVMAQQLHDCGIVYHRERPYIFCFMTQGKDVQNLYDIISHISRIVYDDQGRQL